MRCHRVGLLMMHCPHADIPPEVPSPMDEVAYQNALKWQKMSGKQFSNMRGEKTNM